MPSRLLLLPRLASLVIVKLGFFGEATASSPLVKTSSQRKAESCVAINIIVIIMKLWNCRFSIIKRKEIIESIVHRSLP